MTTTSPVTPGADDDRHGFETRLAAALSGVERGGDGHEGDDELAGAQRRVLHQAAELAREVRRQRALASSISQFAADVTSVRRANSALARLVSRTRELVGVDLAYVSLNEAAGEDGTRVVATSGVYTEAYRTLRMTHGEGIIGQVARGGGPVQTSDYHADTSLVHTPKVDLIVRDEGVHAILGAPMRVDDAVVGALLVAQRHPHRFDDTEVFLVSMLANLAAVAVDNLQRLGDLDASVADERAVAAELERRVRGHERLRRVDDALVGALTRGDSIRGLAAALGEVFGRRVWIVDLTARFDAGDSELVDAALSKLITASNRDLVPAVGVRSDGRPVTVMAVRRRGELIGAVGVDAGLDGDELPLVERAAQVGGALLVAWDRARGDLTARRRELLEQLIAPPIGGIAPASRTRLAEHGVLPEGPFRILVIDGSPTALAVIDHRLGLDFGNALLRAPQGEQLVAVVPELAFDRLARSVTGEDTNATWRGVRVAHSPELHAFEIIPAELDLVQRILEASKRSGADDRLISLHSHGAIGTFLSKTNLAPTRQMIQEVAGPLLAYDRANGTELADTALVYLEHAHAVTDSAAQLHVHPNTVRQRLDRVATVLGEGWDRGQRGLDLQIALAAWRLLGPEPQTSSAG